MRRNGSEARAATPGLGPTLGCRAGELRHHLAREQPHRLLRLRHRPIIPKFTCSEAKFETAKHLALIVPRSHLRMSCGVPIQAAAFLDLQELERLPV